MTKRDNNLRFMTDLFKDLTEFGKNCFHVQIGRGDHSAQEVAFVNISLLGGDNEHLNYVCGTSSMCNGRNCRRCMSNRTYRFMVEPGECMIRKDNDHEVLSKRLKELRTKQLLRVAGGRNYVKSIPEKDLVALSQNLGITKVGLNVMYSRFWYWNYRGLPGLHASCPPDWLHTILKGAVEKTLSAILILVEFFSKFDVSILMRRRRQRTRLYPWKNSKSVLDWRIRNFPIQLFNSRFCRYVVYIKSSLSVC
jgi:hypothetical protein